DGCIQSIRRIIGSCGRSAKKCHQPITKVFIKRSTMGKNYIGHGRKVAIEQTDNLLRRRMLRNSSKSANVGKKNRDGLINATELERVWIVEHLLNYVL